MTTVTKSQMGDYFSKHPRMMGVLFMVGLFASKAVGHVEAGGGAATAGP